MSKVPGPSKISNVESATAASPTSQQLKQEYVTWRRERLHRTRILVVVVPGILGLCMAFSRIVFPEISFDRSDHIGHAALQTLTQPLAILMMMATSLTGLSMLYLQTGFKRENQNQQAQESFDSELRSIHARLELQQQPEHEAFEKLQQQLQELRHQVASLPSTTDGSDQQLVAAVEDRIRESASASFVEDLRKTVAKSNSSDNWNRQFAAQVEQLLQRLGREVSTLGRRGNLNLALGITTTIGGIVSLGYFVHQLADDGKDPWAFAIHFVPRLSVVILVETFAFFFLRLYRTTLAEIKYFQNEITNVEMKGMAIHCARHDIERDVMSKIAEALASTERNRILEKGQTTVDLERARLDSKGAMEALKTAQEIAKGR